MRIFHGHSFVVFFIILFSHFTQAQTNPPIIDNFGIFGHVRGDQAASCDINNDGYEDLILGAPRGQVFNATLNKYIDRAGALVIFYGTASTPDFDNPQIITLNSPGLDPLKVVKKFQFGKKLIVGDFNNDEYCDIVTNGKNIVDVLFRTDWRFNNYVLWGSDAGVNTSSNQIINLEILDPELWNDDSRRTYDGGSGWGLTGLQPGDFNGDGVEDLLLSHPGQTMFTPNGCYTNISRRLLYT